jgi:hypothetical protein
VLYSEPQQLEAAAAEVKRLAALAEADRTRRVMHARQTLGMQTGRFHVAFAGTAGAGKSALINVLVGSKVGRLTRCTRLNSPAQRGARRMAVCLGSRCVDATAATPCVCMALHACACMCMRVHACAL